MIPRNQRRTTATTTTSSRFCRHCRNGLQLPRSLYFLFGLIGFMFIGTTLMLLMAHFRTSPHNDDLKAAHSKQQFSSTTLVEKQSKQRQDVIVPKGYHQVNHRSDDNNHTVYLESPLFVCPTWPPKLANWIHNLTARKPLPLLIPDDVEILFSPSRDDRSGSAILDMLFAHAFSYTVGRKYGGACGSSPYADDYHRLIQVLGFQKELAYNAANCPPLTTNNNDKKKKKKKKESNVHGNRMMLPRDSYRDWLNSRIFTQEWLCYMQQVRLASEQTPTRRDGGYSYQQQQQQHVVVHIRRGDITPCSTVIRYLPNLHYLRLLDLYEKNNNNTRVTIFTEKPQVDCSEDFSPFLDRGMTLLDGNNASTIMASQQHSETSSSSSSSSSLPSNVVLLNAEMEYVWRTMMLDADVLILSKSAFSYVPALFTKAHTVVFSKFFFGPLPHWQLTPREIVMETNRDTARLKRQCCYKDENKNNATIIT